MKTIHIYSDESRQKNERFMLLSGLWIEEQNVKTARADVERLRARHGYTNSDGKHVDFLGEFKWGKVSDKYYHVYKDLVDTFFEWIAKDVARYCCMLVDTHDPVVQKFHNIDKDGYFKLLYQLYFHNSKIPAVYKIFPDSISNPTKKVNLPKLDASLDTSLRKKFLPLLNPADKVGEKGFVNNITPIDSKSSDLIQVIDVIMGAIGFLQNGLFRRNKVKKAKVKLMKYIFEKISLSGAMFISGKKYYVARSTRFNIWLFKPRNKI